MRPHLDCCRMDFARHRMVPHIGSIGGFRRIAARLPQMLARLENLHNRRKCNTARPLRSTPCFAKSSQSFSLPVLDPSLDSSLASNTHKLVLMFLLIYTRWCTGDKAVDGGHGSQRELGSGDGVDKDLERDGEQRPPVATVREDGEARWQQCHVVQIAAVENHIHGHRVHRRIDPVRLRRAIVHSCRIRMIASGRRDDCLCSSSSSPR
jgi:hypothetical protein